MPRPVAPRLPFEPFERFYGPVYALVGRRPSTPNGLLRAVHELTGVGLRTLIRWRLEGVPDYAADRLAIGIGAHPSEIWPEWIDR